MPAISIEINTADQLYQRTRTERSNRDLFAQIEVNGRPENKRLHYLCPRLYQKQTHFVVSIGRRIVAIGSVEMYEDYPDCLYIAAISVEAKHKGKGFSRRILEAIYAYAAEHGRKVYPSAFSEEGQVLKHIHDELDARYPQAACGEPYRDHFTGHRRPLPIIC